MKRKRLLRTASLLFVLLCVFIPSATPAFAADTPTSATVYSIGTSRTYAQISISSKQATCIGKTFLNSGYKASSTLTLQRSSNGSSWSNIKSWTGGAFLSKTYSISSGYYYRVKFSVKVSNASGAYVETVTAYSSKTRG